MAAYRRVYDSRHLQTDCQEPGSAPEPYTRQSSMGYLFISNQKLKKHPGHDASCAWHNTVATSSRDPSYKHKSFTQQKLLTLYLHVHCCWAPVSTLYSHLTSNSALSEYEHAKELKSTLSGSEFHTLTTCWLKTMNVFNRHMTFIQVVLISTSICALVPNEQIIKWYVNYEKTILQHHNKSTARRKKRVCTKHTKYSEWNATCWTAYMTGVSPLLSWTAGLHPCLTSSSAISTLYCIAAVFGVLCTFNARSTVSLTYWYDTRSSFNVRSKADISQLNLLHGAKKAEAYWKEDGRWSDTLINSQFLNTELIYDKDTITRT